MASALSFKPSFENPAAWRDVKSQKRRLRLRTERPAMPQPNGKRTGSASTPRRRKTVWYQRLDERAPSGPFGQSAKKERLVLNSPQRKSSPRKRLTRWCEIVAPDTTSDASDGARPSDRRPGMVPQFQHRITHACFHRSITGSSPRKRGPPFQVGPDAQACSRVPHPFTGEGDRQSRWRGEPHAPERAWVATS